MLKYANEAEFNLIYANFHSFLMQKKQNETFDISQKFLNGKIWVSLFNTVENTAIG